MPFGHPLTTRQTFQGVSKESRRALTEREVNREFGSQSAKLNSPGCSTAFQAFGSSETQTTFTFGGIEMGLRF